MAGAISVILATLLYGFWPRPIAADVLVDQSITIDGAVRNFRLVVPDAMPSNSPPVVFAFHGIGDSPESMAAYSQLDRLAADSGFLLVYPEAVQSMWSTMNLDPDELDQNADVRFFDNLVDHLSKRFKIDPDRVYLVGMSNGASFAQVLAFARPSVAAVVAHSGTMPRELRSAARPFPVLLLVGANDSAADTVQTAATEYRNRGHPARFISVPGLGHQWSTEQNAEIWVFLSKCRRDRSVASEQ